MDYYEVIIVGGGPAGLASGGRLKKTNIPFIILEKEQVPTPSWRNHYDRLHLHTVAKYSNLPFKPFPKEFPQYIPKDQLVQYYQDYAEDLDLPIKFNSTVTSIEKNEYKNWIIQTTGGVSYEANDIIMATGFNRKPNLPEIEGIGEFNGSIIHSSQYKNAEKYSGTTGLVVGMGNSGAEIALDLAENMVNINISVRGPVNIVPRDFLGNPTQVTAKKLQVLPLWLSDWIGNRVQEIAFGDLKPYGITIPEKAPAKQLREEAKTPVLDIGTVKMIKSGKIKVFPGILKMDRTTVYFEDGSTLKPDHIILATGFKPAIEQLIKNASPLLNLQGNPNVVSGVNEFEGLHFVGFDAYSNGILESIYRDSEKVVDQIINKRKRAVP